ncbi:MAG: valine--tRNA ligase [Bacteroides sp.]|nr:valine--tRNA ligase [Bacteroides sp.]MCM1378586.1 valine--tRNA ligase [Bacteroides sp.]MCM1444887.1 valine--tRNA ligase [Prevotella sp.]
MNELPTKYSPAEVEDRLYSFWMEHDLFHSEPDGREPYTIVIPPPNVTGVLHMGHMLNNTIQDILVRRARMEGKNALWVPGTDHASIATETKVIAKLAAEGIKKTDLTREEFLEHAWDWTRTHGGIILQQLRKLGASCDWKRTAFTMDEERSKSVTRVFCDLYNKGLIYRGLRMVNWDPKNLTAISDDEVNYVEEHSKLYYLRYYVAGDPEGRYAVVATTRPETIPGDTAMCINPKDPKNEWLKGKRVIVPLVGREIPVIEDRYVEIEFGTGCLKVTPAHDKNDYMLGKTHNLETIDIFNDDATLNENGGKYAGMDRFACRKQIAADLEAAGLMEKVEDYTNKVGYSERTKVVIEPRLSQQWFINMKHFADISLAPVMDDLIKFVPEKYKTTYRVWLENIQDWCISRQLWWGHRIPAYYYAGADGEVKIAVAESAELALEKARKDSGLDLKAEDLMQDEDALDTWFSSWLWPITLFNGILNPGNEELKYYYPTSTLVTGPDIIFFWVARMIMAGYEYVGEMPFKNVYFTGIVRDKIGRKMSKSLGNSPDPLELIATYGADGVRMGMMLAAPAGNDIMFDEKLCEQGRNFCNKIWNAFRLVQGWEVDEAAEQSEAAKVAVEWFDAKVREAAAEVADQLGKFRISEALMTVYKLFWDEFSSWYLEMVKPAYGSPIDGKTLRATLDYFDRLLRLLHPFMPFITEELWQHLSQRAEGESIMYAPLPEAGECDAEILELMNHAKEVVNGIRGVRAHKQIAPKVALTLEVVGALDSREAAAVSKLANLEAVNSVESKAAGSAVFMVGTQEFGIPMEAAGVDTEAERAKLQKELDYQRGFLAAVEKKLANERFVSGAPAAVVEAERRKQSDALSRIAALESSLAAL